MSQDNALWTNIYKKEKKRVSPFRSMHGITYDVLDKLNNQPESIGGVIYTSHRSKTF